MFASKRTSAAVLAAVLVGPAAPAVRPAMAPLPGCRRTRWRRRSTPTCATSCTAGARRSAPGAERRRALFDFVYQTYDSSAWIPQSIFDGNLVTQAVVGDVDTIVRDKVGLVLWRDNPRVLAFGMAPSRAADKPLMWTVNCLVCHTAEIDGVAYFGAGTKVFDDRVLGEALKLLTSEAWRRLRRTAGPGPRRARAPHPDQPSSRQDRLADARPIDGICRVSRRAVHAAPRRRDAGGR